jgi:2',3'-cyclic-nucleotide 2'-phosphodiesterase
VKHLQFSACYHRILKILFIGDIFGRPGRTIVKDRLPELRQQHAVDLVIANCENAAAGFGITPPLAEELFDLGIDVMTTGNHVWDKREIIEYFQMADGNPHSPARRLLRPANFPQSLPGWGVYEGQKNGVAYAVVNLQGRVFMGSSDDPFRYADRLLEQIKSKIVLVDFHAEASSEKVAFGWYLDGRVTAVVGTHTHIPTADETVLPKGTAYITDVGMTGPYDSVIGVKKELVIESFSAACRRALKRPMATSASAPCVVECDDQTGRATRMERLMLRERKLAIGLSVRPLRP